jgi:hypothetical protein
MAVSNGELQPFNREYRRHRIEAAARRLPFPPLQRRARPLAGTIAGTKSPSELIPAVLDVREILNERRRAI